MPTQYWCPHQVLKATGAPEVSTFIFSFPLLHLSPFFFLYSLYIFYISFYLFQKEIQISYRKFKHLRNSDLRYEIQG
jgi:hypothetical protein